MRKQVLWGELYRPTKIEDCIFPEDIKKSFREFAETGMIPNILISGGAGCGKTTIVTALCHEIGCDFMIIDGSTENGVDDIRNKVQNYATSVSLSGGRKCIIIDEADFLSANAQGALRGIIQNAAPNCAFVFTCNYKNKIIDAIHSRCTVIDVKITKEESKKLMTQFLKRVCYILDSEKIEYTKEVVVQLLKKYYPDGRRIINELQRYGASGTIDVGILSNLSDTSIKVLVDAIKAKKFGDIRKWVAEESIDYSTFYRKIYDTFYELLKPNSVMNMILLIGKYQFQDGLCVDKELNLLSFFVEFMIDAEFK